MSKHLSTHNRILGRLSQGNGIVEELHFVAGTNITITYDASTGAITIEASGGGGGMAIGDPVTDGDANDVLFVDGSGDLGQDDNFTYDGSTLTLADPTFTASRTLLLGDGAVVFNNNVYDLSFGNGALGDSSGSGGSNIAIGVNDPLGSTFTGDNDTAVGAGAGVSVSSGAGGSFYGSQSGATLTSAANCTMVGYACDGTATASNQNSFGYQATCTGANQITLGNTSIGTIRAQVTTITAISDERDKTDIKALPFGLALMKDIGTSSSYVWNMRDLTADKSDEVRARFTERLSKAGPARKARLQKQLDAALAHAARDRKARQDALLKGVPGFGFTAQSLQKAAKKHGAEILGLVDESNPERLEATQGNLLPVHHNAILELAARIEKLEAAAKH